MRITNHISFEELVGNITDVFNLVREEHKSIVVEYANGEKVVIKPLAPVTTNRRRPRKRTHADIAAFRAAAGSWQDEDVDSLIKNIYESRRNSSRPFVEL